MHRHPWQRTVRCHRDGPRARGQLAGDTPQRPSYAREVFRLHARTEHIPGDHHPTTPPETCEVDVDAEDFDAAWRRLRAGLPDGWRVVSIRRVPHAPRDTPSIAMPSPAPCWRNIPRNRRVEEHR